MLLRGLFLLFDVNNSSFSKYKKGEMKMCYHIWHQNCCIILCNHSFGHGMKIGKF